MNRSTAKVPALLRAPAMLAVVALLSAAPALADEPRRARIFSADSDGTRLYIEGRGLGAAASPTVLFGGVSLTVESYSPTAIVAKLPSPTPAPATYALAVRSVSRSDDREGSWATLDVTIGAVGPQGPAGPTGPVGPTGATGPQGFPGAPGAPGAAGAPGATGATGAQGAVGSQGPVGPQGPQGPAGPAGGNGGAGSSGSSLQAWIGWDKTTGADHPIYDFSWGESRPVGTAGGGPGGSLSGGRVSFSGFSFTKPIDDLTATILVAGTGGATPIGSIVIEVGPSPTKPTAPSQSCGPDCTMVFTLTNPLVSSTSISGPGGTQDVTIVAPKVQVEVIPTKGTKTKFCWDVATNKKC